MRFLYPTKRQAVFLLAITAFLLNSTAIMAQKSVLHARRTVVLGAKNMLLTKSNGTTYYYMVTSESPAVVKIQGDNVLLGSDTFEKSEIKSIRFKEMEKILLNEDSTVYNTAQTVEHGLVGLRRSLNTGKWNSIVLPFALTGEQILDAFGEGTMVAEFKGIKEDDNATVELNSLNINTSGVVMKANYCYLIRPTNEPDYTADQRVMTFGGTKLYGPIYLLPNINMSAKQSPRTQLFSSEDKATSIRLRGTYAMLDNSVLLGSVVRNKKIAPGTFMINDEGLMAENVDSTIVKAFASWIVNEGETKSLRFYINGAEEDISAIADAICLPTVFATKSEADVYDIHGRRIAHLRDGEAIGSLNLPSGIYIVRGLKVVVK